MATTYSYSQLVSFARQAGFGTTDAGTMARIALAESGGDPNSYNPNAGTGDNSYGLWQINMLGNMGPERLKQFGLKSNDQLFDPVANARAAYQIYKQQGFGAWSTYKSGAYTKVDPASYPGGQPASTLTKTAGGQVASTPANQRLTAQELSAEYSYAASFFNLNPELHTLLYGPKGALAEQWTPDKFKAALMNTQWYKSHNDSQRQWAALQAADPTTAKRQLSLKAQQVHREAVAQGVALTTAQVNNLASQALQLGMTDDELLNSVNGHLKYLRGQHFGGEAGATQDQIQQIAAAYGVPFGQDAIGSAVVRIQNGQQTIQDFQDLALKNAKLKYAAFGSELDKGLTMKDIVNPYVNQYAQTLEVDPAAVDWTKDPTIQKALAVPGTKPGEPPSAMPLWQFDQTLKQDPRWLKTDNARNSLMDTATHILSDMGVYSG